MPKPLIIDLRPSEDWLRAPPIVDLRDASSEDWMRQLPAPEPVSRTDYDEDQPRDEAGRWTSTGGAASSAPKAAEPNGRTLLAERRDYITSKKRETFKNLAESHRVFVQQAEERLAGIRERFAKPGEDHDALLAEERLANTGLERDRKRLAEYEAGAVSPHEHKLPKEDEGEIRRQATERVFASRGLGEVHNLISHGWVQSSSSPGAMLLHTSLLLDGVPGSFTKDNSEKMQVGRYQMQLTGKSPILDEFKRAGAEAESRVKAADEEYARAAKELESAMKEANIPLEGDPIARDQIPPRVRDASDRAVAAEAKMSAIRNETEEARSNGDYASKFAYQPTFAKKVARYQALSKALTQAALDEDFPGQTHFRLFRGIHGDVAKTAHEAKGPVRVQARPATSWSANFVTASDFARRGEVAGAILEVLVPKSSIISYYGLYQNSFAEDEFVVTGAEALPVRVADSWLSARHDAIDTAGGVVVLEALDQEDWLRDARPKARGMQRAEERADYSENQPRNELGRWISMGGGESGGSFKPSPEERATADKVYSTYKTKHEEIRAELVDRDVRDKNFTDLTQLMSRRDELRSAEANHDKRAAKKHREEVAALEQQMAERSRAAAHPETYRLTPGQEGSARELALDHAMASEGLGQIHLDMSHGWQTSSSSYQAMWLHAALANRGVAGNFSKEDDPEGMESLAARLRGEKDWQKGLDERLERAEAEQKKISDKYDKAVVAFTNDKISGRQFDAVQKQFEQASHKTNRIAEAKDRIEALTDKDVADLNRYVGVNHALTTRALDEAYPAKTSFTLYRGVHGDPASDVYSHVAAGGEPELHVLSRPATSWTPKLEVAETFAEREGKAGAVLSVQVQKENIFAFHGLHKNLSGEDEFVVLGVDAARVQVSKTWSVKGNPRKNVIVPKQSPKPRTDAAAPEARPLVIDAIEQEDWLRQLDEGEANGAAERADFNEDQPRDDLGRWTDAGGAGPFLAKRGGRSPKGGADLHAMMAEVQARNAKIKAFTDRGERRLSGKGRTGQVAVTPDLTKPGIWRVTRLDPQGEPIGHTEHSNYHDAVKSAVVDHGMSLPKDQPEKTAEELLEVMEHKPEGFSWRPDTHHAKSGIMVAPHPEKVPSTIIEYTHATKASIRANVRAFVQQHYDEIMADPALHFGGWKETDEKGSRFWLDVARRYPKEEREAAIAAGRANNQLAVWDLDNGVEIKTGGTGK